MGGIHKSKYSCYRPPGWRVSLRHCIAVLAVPPETLGASPGSGAAGRDREVRGETHNWPSVVRVREGLAGRDVLVSLRTSDFCGGPGAVFPPTHWCGWLPGWMRAVLRSSAAWLGCVSEDAWLSSFVSRKSPYGSCSDETRQ